MYLRHASPNGPLHNPHLRVASPKPGDRCATIARGAVKGNSNSNAREKDRTVGRKGEEIRRHVTGTHSHELPLLCVILHVPVTISLSRRLSRRSGPDVARGRDDDRSLRDQRSIRPGIGGPTLTADASPSVPIYSRRQRIRNTGFIYHVPDAGQRITNGRGQLLREYSRRRAKGGRTFELRL